MIRLLYHLFSPLEWEKLRVWGMGVVRELWQLDANKITFWNNDNAFLVTGKDKKKKKQKTWVRRLGVLICN